MIEVLCIVLMQQELNYQVNSNSSSILSLFMSIERVLFVNETLRSKKKFDCISEFFVSHKTTCSSSLMLFNKP